MKSIRNIAFSALLTIGAFTAITYTSCNKDECKNTTCQNGGNCIGEDMCSCPTGYEGNLCQDRTVVKFIGQWQGTDVCTSRSYPVTLSIGAGTNAINATVSNPGGFGGTVTITGTIQDTDKITFSAQSVGGGRTLTGTMTFNGNAMTFNYTVTATVGGGDSCNGTYVKL